MKYTVIVLSGQEAASNTDILQGTRLQTVPGPGVLEFELQSSDSDATNNYTASIQLPSGDTPLNAARVPAGAATGLAGVIDEREALKLRFQVQGGGHTVFSCIEAGSAELSWRVVFKGMA